MEDRVGKYCLNQKVWFIEHEKPVEARVMRAEVEKGAFLYKVDYQGGMVYFESDLFQTKEDAVKDKVLRYEEDIKDLNRRIKVVKNGL